MTDKVTFVNLTPKTLTVTPAASNTPADKPFTVPVGGVAKDHPGATGDTWSVTGVAPK